MDGTKEAVAPAETRPLNFRERLHAAASALRYVQKKGYNAHFKYKFVSEADIKASVKDVLADYGLVLEHVTYDVIGGAEGKSLGQACTLRCQVVIACVDGGNDRAVFQGIGSGTDSSDKAPMKACAAALKYALTSGFLIPTGDDPEKDESGPEPETRKESPTDLSTVEFVLTARIRAAASADALAAIKPDVLALQTRDVPAYERVVAKYRTKSKEFKK